MNPHNWRSLIALTLFTSLLSASCSDFFNSEKTVSYPVNPTPPPPSSGNPLPEELQKPNEGAFSEKKMLANIGLNIIAPRTVQFRLQSELLEMKIADYCSALNSAQFSTALEEAQTQWKSAMLQYHRLESIPLGPLSDSKLLPATKFYAYPNSNTCGLDELIARGSLDKLSTLPYSYKGLSILEYLLFEKNLVSSCPANVRPLAHQWATQKPELEKRLDRCQWAQAISKELKNSAQTLEDSWSEKKQNYTLYLVNDSLYSTTQKAVNAYSDALFALESLKDQRLGKPLGLHKACSKDVCPESLEHPYSNLAFRAQEASLIGFIEAFQGSPRGTNSGFGLDDLLMTKGYPDLAEQVLSRAEQTLATNNKLAQQGPIKDYVVAIADPLACERSTPEDRQIEICAYQREVRAIVNFMKTDVLTALSLLAPPAHEGDND